MRLVDVIDNLLNILDNDKEFKYFHLDGQTALLEDYLEICPENEKRLKKYIKEGRILVGPWYVQPDEFLVSPESLIRNLILGHKMAEEFGNVMKVGYLPDTFCHISQMPQIFQGFGIDNAVLWRGIGGPPNKLKSEFYWQSPDGSKVITVHFLDDVGYTDAANLPEDVKKAYEKIIFLKKEHALYATTSHLLLMNGIDHAYPQPYLSRVIKGVNKSAKGMHLIHSTLPKYIERVKKARPSLKIVNGELRDCKYVHMPPSCQSSRVYLKQRNEEIQVLLERWAEPFAAIAWTLGRRYPSSLLWQSWKYLLQNHPHDSIGGCSIDPVHEEMILRFSSSQQIAEKIVDDSLNFISEKIDTACIKNEEDALIVFNPLNWQRTDLVSTDICFPVEKGIKGFHLLDKDGKKIPCKIERKSQTEIPLISPYSLPKWIDVNSFKVNFLVENIPGCGYKTYRLVPTNKPFDNPEDFMRADNVLENEHLRVMIEDNGSLTITDKMNKAAYRNCNVFEDSGDAGDEYNYFILIRIK